MVAPITPQNVQSPQSVTRKRRLAEAMMQQGTDTSPVGHPLGALARALQGGMAGYMSHKADTAEKEGLAGVMAKMQSGDNAGAMMDPWATDGTSRLAQIQYEQSQPKPPIEVGGRLIDPETYQPVYEPPAEPEKPQIVPKGANVYQNGEWITPPAAMGGQQAIDDPLKISKNFETSPGMERIAQIAPTIKSMHASLNDPSAMADLDFVYGLAKILDPTSVVRESEAGMVIDAQGIAPTMLGQLNKLMSGEQAMLPEIRQKLFGVAMRRAQELALQAEQERSHFSGVAQANQYDPELYLQQVPGLPDMPQAPQAQSQGAPQPTMPPPPPGVNPLEWQHMTPEERALWNQ
jgi:hypothetical protein